MADFSILAVCTGNVCRSPAVESLLRAGLGGSSEAGTGARPEGIRILSAGTHALVGEPVSAPMAALIEAAGGSVHGFSSQQLTAEMVRDADLVIAMSREHRAATVTLHPAAVRRTFTLRELARLARACDLSVLPAGGTVERFVSLVPLAVTARGPHPGRPDDDDVLDPYGRRPRVYRAAFAQLLPAVDAILAAVRPGADAGAAVTRRATRQMTRSETSPEP